MHVLVNIIGMKMFCLQQSLNVKRKLNRKRYRTSSEQEEENFYAVSCSEAMYIVSKEITVNKF